MLCNDLVTLCVCRNGKRGQGWARKYVVLDGTKVSIYETEPREGCLPVWIFNRTAEFIDPLKLPNTISNYRSVCSVCVAQTQWSHWRSLTCVCQMERWWFMELWEHLSYQTPPSQVDRSVSQMVFKINLKNFFFNPNYLLPSICNLI